MRRPQKRTPFADRFWPKVNVRGPIHPFLGTACWEWMASTNKGGYGGIGRGGRNGGQVLAHRASWELRNGPIADGLDVLHRCDNPRCVNPDHLFLGTDLENRRDASAKGRLHKAVRATRCKYGHEYTPENTYQTRKGSKRCRACARIYDRARYMGADFGALVRASFVEQA